MSVYLYISGTSEQMAFLYCVCTYTLLMTRSLAVKLSFVRHI